METKENTSIFITGAGSGMGQLAAINVAKQGYHVAAVDINEQGLLETAKQHQNIRTFNVDVTNYDAVCEATDKTERDLGPIERVYNAAAIMPLGKIVEQDVEVFHQVMNINYNGVVNVSKAILPKLLERNKGALINFASLAGFIPILYMAAYNASKFAVVSFTEILHHENLNSDVKIRCVCPPHVKTPLLDQARETIWPNMFNQTKHLEAKEVLEAIEEALKKKECFVFPGKNTKWMQRARRWLPNTLWKTVHNAEGF